MATSRTSGSGPSQRQLRVGEVIRRRLAEVLARGETGDPELDGVSVTVSEVRMTPDLRQAMAFVLPLGGQNADAIVAALHRNRAILRRIVTAGITLRYSPELSFAPDRSFDQADRTRRLLESEAVQRDVARPDDAPES
jgi:ribosome-binding factor A